MKTFCFYNKRKEFFDNKSTLYQKAFTLTEILVVLAIIGILILLVLPNQSGVVSQAKSLEAQSHLNQVHALQKNYFHIHSKYSESLEDINYTPAKLIDEGGNANYRIEIVESSHNSFRARATAVTDFDGDGTFNVWEIDQDKNLKEVTKD